MDNRKIIFLLALLILVGILSVGDMGRKTPPDVAGGGISALLEGSAILPVRWGNLGQKMVQTGVIDGGKFEAFYGNRLSEEDLALLYGEGNESLRMTKENSGIVLNLLWAFGLSNKNPILEDGPMKDPRYGGAENFASTGGWTMARVDAMEHYGKHEFVKLTPAQQVLVEKVSKNIYRPCCDNSTYFPDCNHGMAMLGLLELLASQGATEEEMYRSALVANSYWFPDSYETIARYLSVKGTRFADVSPKEILGRNFSSASGYQKLISEISSKSNSGVRCSV